eukprot:TRINITY_DN2925_c0_g3_i1.p1 TRINITY_DN2925_c0_g3~~TRINITY_DN2925_c0_g3_i1.p1  ORF type:complete len:1768 (+),score=518.71 TRINITY_DN2925_c0_g3_i1:83-5386(+)
MAQFWPLFKKNVKFKVSRSKKSFAITVLTPTIFVVLLALLRLLVKSSPGESELFNPIAIPKLDEMYWDGTTSPQFDVQDWYFGGEGASNIFVTCDTSDGNLQDFLTDFEEYCTLSKLAITTEDTATASTKTFASKFNDWLRNKFPLLEDKDLTVMFDKETDWIDLVESEDYVENNKLTGAAVVFDSVSLDEYKYRLRFNSTFTYERGIPNTNLPSNKRDFARGESEFTQLYRLSGFLTMQSEIDQFIAEEVKSEVSSSTDLTNFSLDATNLFPIRPYEDDGFWVNLSGFIGLFTILSVIKPMGGIIKDLVGEKESKMRETLFIMNARRGSYRWSWLLLYFIQMVFTALFMSVFSKYGNLAGNSDISVTFVVYLAFLLSCTSFMYFISVFFGRTKTASLVAIVLFLATYFPAAQFNTTDYDTSLKLATSLAPPSAITYTFTSIANLEGGDIGSRWDNLDDNGSGFSVLNGLVMMTFDMFMYLILGIYFENILSPTGGVAKKWYFCLTPSFFCGKKSHFSSPSLQDYDTFAEKKSNFQEVPDILKSQDREGKSVRITDLRREFHTNVGTKVAVKRLNLSFYKSQITALLGHNGAGKTTTISMLTGLIGATSGNAYIGDMKLSEDMDDIRKAIGVCPQHNILYPNLSVKEHLELFANLKGVDTNKIESIIRNMIADVGLVEKTNEAASSLSGGMKRKLHLAIALIGDSKYIFLDEPTSGMDPYSRRFTWDVIRKHRKGRVIVLTTHFMDEAEILADRIAIMNEGELKCVGSALFLKQIYGVGYTFTIAKRDGMVGSANATKFVRQYIPSASVISDVGAELSFRLPLESGVVFEKMLTDLENNKDQLGVASYGISVTTLEEVFLRIAKGTENIRLEEIQKAKVLRKELSETTIAVNKDTKVSHIEDMSPFQVASTHFKALMYKRWNIYKRDKRSWCLQIVLPLIFLSVGMAFLKFRPKLNQPELIFNLDNTDMNNPMPWAYGKTTLSDEFVPTWNSMGLKPTDAVTTTLSGKYIYGGTELEINTFNDAHKEFSTWLVDNWDNYEETRYSAVYSTTIDGGFTAFANSTAFHAAPIASNAFSQAFISNLAGRPITILTSNHPMPATENQTSIFKSQNGFAAALFIVMALAFLPSSWIYFVVQERETKAKHQQLLSGVSTLAYWGATWVWDTLNTIVPVILMVAIIYLFQVDEYTEEMGALLCTILTILIFGFSVAPFTYLLSWTFKKPSNAQTATTTMNFVTGLILLIANFILFILARGTQKYMVFFFRLFPMFCLGNTLSNIASIKMMRLVFGEPDMSFFDMEISGWNIIFLVVGAFIYFILTMVVEQMMSNPKARKLLTREPHVPIEKEELDRDVEAEQQRVALLDKHDQNLAAVYIKGLRKVYPTLDGGAKVGVKDIHIAIPKGECFGLLGVNGAGKTTTMCCMTGEFPPSAGEAYLAGIDILSEPQKARRLIGYCPQFDALFDRMTAYEHLNFYAKLKGVKKAIRDDIVKEKLKEMQLTEFAHKQAAGFSGGNKRKLSVAQALIGNPKILFLDEPSTGVDPVARRFMWDVISRIATKTSVILTTHSMEECEALCSRIGIMVGGQLRCLGSSQHLKNRFGIGYQLELSLKPCDDKMIEVMANKIGQVVKTARMDLNLVKSVLNSLDASSYVELLKDGANGAAIYHTAMGSGITPRALASWLILEQMIDQSFKRVISSFPNSILKERQGYTLRFEVPCGQKTIAEMFGQVTRFAEELPIESYSLSQTTLEQIFNRFASEQEEETGQPAGIM